MGLFSAKPIFQKQDYEIALVACKRVARWWNEEHSAVRGFRLVVAAPNLNDSCRNAAKLFDERPTCFASPPSPFKRVAAFIVAGCLEPFFDFRLLSTSPRPPLLNSFPKNEHEKRVWRVRFLLLTLPELFNHLRANVNDHWEKVHWNGFPSPHFQLEFMNWLKWLDRLSAMKALISEQVDWDAFQKKRFSRMVMATALALEASSYTHREDPKGLQGKIRTCMRKLTPQQYEDLNFIGVPGTEIAGYDASI